ncbi:MAG: DNA-binding YbaB/EbfC family protein, partial [Gammaproteobacteria bacterium]
QAQQMQEQMQQQLKQAQEELATLEVTGEAGAGMVQIVMNGRHDVRKVHIDPAVVGDDLEMLEDLIAAAVNDAVHRVETQSQSKMSNVTAGLNLPAGFKLPL